MSLLIGLTGCPVADDGPAKQKPLTVAPPDAIKLLVIGDTEIGPKLVRQWKAHQDGQLSVENQSQAEWIKAGFPISDGTDLNVYPTLLLGELAEAKKISQARIRGLEFRRNRQRHLAEPLPPHADSLWQ